MQKIFAEISEIPVGTQFMFFFMLKPRTFLRFSNKVYNLPNGNSVIRSLEYPVWIVVKEIRILGGYGFCGSTTEIYGPFFNGTRAWNFAKFRAHKVIDTTHH